MSDELDDLRKAMHAATPRPDPAVRQAHLRQAQEIFDRTQAAAAPARPNSEDHPAVGWFQSGVNAVIRTLSPLKATLVATTAIVAVGVVLVLPQTRSLLTPPGEVTLRPEIAPQEVRREAGPATLDDLPIQEPTPAPRDQMATAELAAAPEAAASRAAAGRGVVAPLPASPAPPPSVVGIAGADAKAFAPLAEIAPPAEPNTEAFANAAPNPVKVTAEEPVSTFSIDVDTASYAVVRSSLMRGNLPPTDAVRVEEMVNYFPYAYPAPDGAHPFQPTVTVMGTPWNPGTQLVHIALQGKKPAIEDRPPLNLVFLIDTSGSMESPDKLPLLRQSFRLMLDGLRPEDQVAIVAYAGSSGLVLPPTAASDKAAIGAALDRLSAGGSTAGQAGLEQAYAVAASMAGEGEVSRVILATDGDFNVGIHDPQALKEFIARKRDGGAYLSVLGFGRGNLDDATMQALAQNGNGTAAYIDTLNEARKVLVDELSGALFPIADDVKIQVEWNPAAVAEYRLIGYETRALRREDFNNDRVDAGEIGAGTAVTAIYEITPVGSPAVLNDPLRYGAAPAQAGNAEELGFLRLRYKAPGQSESVLIETPIPVGTTEPGTEARFGAAIAGFGQLLRGSTYLGAWSWDDAIALANSAKGTDDFGYRAEAVTLMRLAKGLSRN